MRRLRRLLASLTLLAATAQAADAPPNLVPISPTLVTSGQPSSAWLQTLKAQGFEAVVYLAPAHVHDAVRDEPQIVTRQGLAFHHLPIPFGKPTESDYDTFAALMHSLQGKKVLVHCQVNMRASTMTFLYRVIVEKQAPEPAYQAVSRVWTPEGPWQQLMLAELRKHGIGFDPF